MVAACGIVRGTPGCSGSALVSFTIACILPLRGVPRWRRRYGTAHASRRGVEHEPNGLQDLVAKRMVNADRFSLIKEGLGGQVGFTRALVKLQPWNSSNPWLKIKNVGPTTYNT